MEPTPQPAPSTPVVSSSMPGMFGTKIPSSVAFAVAILLFFLPFAEIKCGGRTFAKNSGLGIALGKDWQAEKESMFGNETNKMDNDETKKQDPNVYAIVALGLGVLGLLLSFANARSAAGAAVVTGILSAGALIGLMLDLQKKVKGNAGGPPAKGDGSDLFGLDKLNDVKMTIDFTPWFYVAVIAFLAAAFFSYRRMTSKKI